MIVRIRNEAWRDVIAELPITLQQPLQKKSWHAVQMSYYISH